MLFRRLAAAALIAAALAMPQAGQAAGPHDEITQGPKVGEKIPHDLSALDQNRQHRDFKALARARGLIVLFTRSVDW